LAHFFIESEDNEKVTSRGMRERERERERERADCPQLFWLKLHLASLAVGGIMQIQLPPHLQGGPGLHLFLLCPFNANALSILCAFVSASNAAVQNAVVQNAAITTDEVADLLEDEDPRTYAYQGTPVSLYVQRHPTMQNVMVLNWEE